MRRRRLELRLSQRELAGEGVSYACISRIEKATRNPSVRGGLRQLAPALRTLDKTETRGVLLDELRRERGRR